jgi:hypothetical protein
LAAKAVHHVFTVPKSLVVVASPGARQSGEWMRKAAEMLARLDIPKRGDGYNKISLLLPNGSRIVGLPEAEAKIRGFSALVRELRDMRMRTSGGMGAEGFGEHDDLVTAPAPACWRARRRENGYRGERLPGT